MICNWQHDGHCWVSECGNEYYVQDEAIVTSPRVVDGACPYCGGEIVTGGDDGQTDRTGN